MKKFFRAAFFFIFSAAGAFAAGGDIGLIAPNEPWYAELGSGHSRMSLNFHSNGQFDYDIRWTSPTYGSFPNVYGGLLMWEETYKGTYTVSNETLTFTFTSARHKDADKQWESISPPSARSFRYEIRVESSDYWNPNTGKTELIHSRFLDIKGGLPSVSELFKDGMSFKLRYENYTGNTPPKGAVSLEWPGDLMPGVPEYGNKGNIIEINTPSSGYIEKNVRIIIGQTTPEAFSDYCDRVLRSGWILNSLWTAEELKNGKGGSLSKEGCGFKLELGRQNDGNYSIYKRW